MKDVFIQGKIALIIDTLREYIDNFVTPDLFYCITPLLIQASIHVNTSGQFKGFFKNSETGLGQWVEPQKMILNVSWVKLD